jgi:hypothetical protein
MQSCKDAFSPWLSLNEQQKSFFYLSDNCMLAEEDAAQISVLYGDSVAIFITVMLEGIPDYCSTTSRQVLHKDSLNLAALEGQANESDVVQQWLYQTGVPVAAPVYVLYQAHNEFWVVATTWHILVSYWEAFTFSVAVDMLVLDSTKNWLCRFQMEVGVVDFIRYEI